MDNLRSGSYSNIPLEKREIIKYKLNPFSNSMLINARSKNKGVNQEKKSSSYKKH